jgi:uncharacterized protein (DUF2062 family)
MSFLKKLETFASHARDEAIGVFSRFTPFLVLFFEVSID